jgi:hypothetical protein
VSWPRLPRDFRNFRKMLERAKGIEPSYAAWEAAVLPLNYAREFSNKIRYFTLFLVRFWFRIIVSS